MTTLTVDDLLSRASSREQLQAPSDGKSSSTFESVVVDGERYFVKRLPATDWITRVTNDKVNRGYQVWRSGLMSDVPDCIDHTVVAMQVDGEGDDAVVTTMMRDIADCLVPEGDAIVPDQQHANFIDHLAQLSARFWGWRDTIGGLTSTEDRLRFFAGDQVAREMALPDPPGPIVAADAGWRALPQLSPLLAAIAQAVWEEPTLLSAPIAETPATFLHGDWKMGNLGSHPDGRTILLDWAYPGSGPACWDLYWYLALNRARLPESKEASIERFRDALERHGVATTGWFDTQLDLCVIAIMAAFGWEKAIGDEAELRWWETQVAGALERQQLDLPLP